MSWHRPVDESHTVVNAQIHLPVTFRTGARNILTHLRSLLLLLLRAFPEYHVYISPLSRSHVHVELVWLDRESLLDLELIIRVV